MAGVIQQIERRRRLWFRATAGTIGRIVLAAIWAIAECHNAGGWPANGFSRSSGIPNVWDYWIIYRPSLGYWRRPRTPGGRGRRLHAAVRARDSTAAHVRRD